MRPCRGKEWSASFSSSFDERRVYRRCHTDEEEEGVDKSLRVRAGSVSKRDVGRAESRRTTQVMVSRAVLKSSVTLGSRVSASR